MRWRLGGSVITTEIKRVEWEQDWDLYEESGGYFPRRPEAVPVKL